MAVDLPVGTPAPTIPEEFKKQLQWKKGTARKGPQIIFKEGIDAKVVSAAIGLWENNAEVANALQSKLQESETANDPAAEAAETDDDKDR